MKKLILLSLSVLFLSSCQIRKDDYDVLDCVKCKVTEMQGWCGEIYFTDFCGTKSEIDAYKASISDTSNKKNGWYFESECVYSKDFGEAEFTKP